MIYKSGNHLLAMCQTNRYTTVMIIKHKVRSSIDRIYVESKFTLCISTGISFCVFFPEESSSRKNLTQTFDQKSLDCCIIICTEICKPLFFMDIFLTRSRLQHFLTGFSYQFLDCSISRLRTFRGNRIFRKASLYDCNSFRSVFHICFFLHGTFPRDNIPAPDFLHAVNNSVSGSLKSPVDHSAKHSAKCIKDKIRQLECSNLQKQLAGFNSKRKAEADFKAVQ